MLKDKTIILIKKVIAKKNKKIVLLFLLKNILKIEIKIQGRKIKNPNIPKPATCSSVIIFTFSISTLHPVEGLIFII